MEEQQLSGCIQHTPSLLDDDDDDDDEEEAEPLSMKEAAAQEEEWEDLPAVRSSNMNSTGLCALNSNEQQLVVHHQNHHAFLLLSERLRQIRADRRRCLLQQQRCNALREELQHALRTAATYRQEEAVADCVSAVAECRSLDTALALAQQWNVTASDCCYIAACEQHEIATINGLRLGAVESSSAVTAVVVVPYSSSSGSSSSSQPNQTSAVAQQQQQQQPSNSFFSFGITLGAAAPPILPVSEPPSHNKIPWREINAALGQVALLLSTLEQNLHFGCAVNTTTTTTAHKNNSGGPNHKNRIFRHELACLGSTSKIGLRRPAPAATAFYNLYHSEEGAFPFFFAKRNFNTALHMLLECVQEAAAVVQERDRTIVLPYEMVCKGNTYTVGGLSVAFFAAAAATTTTTTTAQQDPHQQAESWTRAMKYLLTNLKHIMVFRGVGLMWTSPEM